MNPEIDISNVILKTERLLIRPWRQFGRLVVARDEHGHPLAAPGRIHRGSRGLGVGNCRYIGHGKTNLLSIVDRVHYLK